MALEGRAERIAMGKQVRERIPRASHAVWAAPPDRPNPLDLLEESQRSRLSHLAPIRWGRMAASPFAFLRGSAMVMAWDLAHLPHSEMYVQACGDAHLCNFGVSATPERRLIFDLRDFDETLPAPWEWDVKRLAASIVVAARQTGMSRAAARDAAMRALGNYHATLRDSLDLTHLDIWYRRVDAEEVEASAVGEARRYAQKTFRKARRRTSARELGRLTELVAGARRIKEEHPLLFRITDGSEDELAHAVLNEYGATLSTDRRLLFERYHLIDIAYRVVGVGSVGTRCMVALFLGDGGDDPLILQIKEASRSVLEPFARRCNFANQGERVVTGQRTIQAASDLFLGWKVWGGRDFYVRQLKDMKGTVDIDDMAPEVIADFAGLCGLTLAQAHARSGDFCQIAGYLGKNNQFVAAIAEFADLYADQVERDWARLAGAVRIGQMPAELGA
jgi:uncharacterized protein (DUF2252 family)